MIGELIIVLLLTILIMVIFGVLILSEYERGLFDD